MTARSCTVRIDRIVLAGQFPAALNPDRLRELVGEHIARRFQQGAPAVASSVGESIRIVVPGVLGRGDEEALAVAVSDGVSRALRGTEVADPAAGGSYG